MKKLCCDRYEENLLRFLKEFVKIGGNGLGVTRSALDLGEIRGLSLLVLCSLYSDFSDLNRPTPLKENYKSKNQIGLYKSAFAKAGVFWRSNNFMTSLFLGKIFNPLCK